MQSIKQDRSKTGFALDILARLPLVIVAIAAVLKLWAVYTGGIFPLAIMFSNTDGALFYSLLGCVEMVFVVLCARAGLRTCLKLQIGFFLVASATAVGLLLYGASSCGCFGALRVPPYAMAILDGGILCYLLSLRFFARLPERQQEKQITMSAEQYGIAAAIVGISAFVLVARHIDDSRSAITSDPVTITDIAVGEERDLSFRVYNRTQYPTEIVGSEKSCSCLTVDLHRVQIPPLGFKDLEVRYRPRVAGESVQKLQLFLSHPSQRWLTLDLRSSVSGGES